MNFKTTHYAYTGKQSFIIYTNFISTHLEGIPFYLKDFIPHYFLTVAYCLQRWPQQSFPSLCALTFILWLLNSHHQKRSLFLFPINMGWPYDILCPICIHRCDIKWLPNVDFKRPYSSHSWLLGIWRSSS